LHSEFNLGMADSFPRTDIVRYIVESVTLHFATLRPSWPAIYRYVQLLTIVLNGHNECDKSYQYNENLLQIIALKDQTVSTYLYCGGIWIICSS
jgi:hypothetical protein